MESRFILKGSCLKMMMFSIAIEVIWYGCLA